MNTTPASNKPPFLATRAPAFCVAPVSPRSVAKFSILKRSLVEPLPTGALKQQLFWQTLKSIPARIIYFLKFHRLVYRFGGERLLQAGLHSARSFQIGRTPVHVVDGSMLHVPTKLWVIPHTAPAEGKISYGAFGEEVNKLGASDSMDLFQQVLQIWRRQNTKIYGRIMAIGSLSPKVPMLIHAVTDGAPKEGALQIVFDATLSALQFAVANHKRSIAIPTLGTGILGPLNFDESSRAILAAVDALDKSGMQLPEVVICCYRGGARQFRDTLAMATYKCHDGFTAVLGTPKS